MSRSWNSEELKTASAAMEQMGNLGYEAFCRELEKQGWQTSPYEQLVRGETAGAHTIEVRHRESGADGVASTCGELVSVWYGADDGSDDKTIGPEQFNEEFEVTAVLGA